MLVMAGQKARDAVLVLYDPAIHDAAPAKSSFCHAPLARGRRFNLPRALSTVRIHSSIQ
jgi:hypothetical protein